MEQLCRSRSKQQKAKAISLGRMEAPYSPHARVRVINIGEYDATMKNKEQLKMSEEGCVTPKKQPAKIVFKDPGKKEEKMTTPIDAKVAEAAAKAGIIKDALPIPSKDSLPVPNTNEEALSEFLKRVSLSPNNDTMNNHDHQHQVQQSNCMGSPQRRNTPPTFNMLPDYARYQEARFRRSYSRGDSVNNLSPKSPGVEWVDHRSLPPGSWDANALVASHSFPASIFCDSGEVSPSQVSAMTAMHQEYGYTHYHHHSAPSSPAMGNMAYHDYHIHRRVYPDGVSIPSAAALSRGSSSSWSDQDEELQQRQFLTDPYMGQHGPSFAHHQQVCQEQEQQEQQHSAAAAASVEEDQERPLVEISPGVHEPLRKADETVRAVRVDFYVPVSCFGCSQDIFCIADAKYVICPTCKVVSPIEEGALEGKVLRQHGLGLGFTCESLFQIQSDILLER